MYYLRCPGELVCGVGTAILNSSRDVFYSQEYTGEEATIISIYM